MGVEGRGRKGKVSKGKEGTVAIFVKTPVAYAVKCSLTLKHATLGGPTIKLNISKSLKDFNLQ